MSFLRRTRVILDDIYCPDIQKQDMEDINKAKSKYFDSINHKASILSFLYLDYACWMDYKRMFNSENIKKVSEDDLAIAQKNYQRILPKESLNEIKEQMGDILMDMMKSAIALLYSSPEFMSIKEVLNKINKYKPTIDNNEYKNIYLELEQFFSPIDLGMNYDVSKNYNFIFHTLSLCEKLGYNLKEKLIEPN